jgi:hypothetical protein
MNKVLIFAATYARAYDISIQLDLNKSRWNYVWDTIGTKGLYGVPMYVSSCAKQLKNYESIIKESKSRGFIIKDL